MEDEDWGGEEPLKDRSEEAPPSDTEAAYGAFEAEQDLCVISNSPENSRSPSETSAETPPAQNPPETLPDDEAGLSGVCPICLQPVDGEAYLDPCFHRFCFSCILHWSATNRSGTPPLCPVCKGPFLTIVHDFRGVQFKRYDVLGGQTAAQFHLSEKHVLRRGVYLEGGPTKPLGFKRGFARSNGRWLRCWVRRELQALLEEDDVEMVALHIVGSVELMAQNLKERERFGKNVRQLRSSDGGEPELLVASLKKPPKKEKQLVFGKTSLVLSKAGLARRKARKNVNGAMKAAAPAKKKVKDTAKILKEEKEREKRESAARKVMQWLDDRATPQQAEPQEAQREGSEERANDGTTAPTERTADRGQGDHRPSEDTVEKEGSAEGTERTQPPSDTVTGRNADQKAPQENGRASTELAEPIADVAGIQKQQKIEGAVHMLVEESLPEAVGRSQELGPQGVCRPTTKNELPRGPEGSRQLSLEESEWLEVVASAARPFVFEHADRFASELMAFLDSGLDIASYDAATLPLPAGTGPLAQGPGVESSMKDLELLKRAIEEENEGDYHVEGASVERPRKTRRKRPEQQYGSLWTAAKEDLAALPRKGGLEEQFGPEREVKRRREKRGGEGDDEERRKKRKHIEKSEEDSDFERRQHRKHKRRRDRHKRHRRERADSVDKSDSSLERAVHAYRKKLRKRRKDGRRLYDGLPLSSTADEAESWVEWRKRMKKLYRFCKTEVEEDSEQSLEDSFWGRTDEARKVAPDDRQSGRAKPGVSGWEDLQKRKGPSRGEMYHVRLCKKSGGTAFELRRKCDVVSEEPADLQRSHDGPAMSRDQILREARKKAFECLPRRGGLKRSYGDKAGATESQTKQVRVRWKDEEMEKQSEQGVRFSDASEKTSDLVGENCKEGSRSCEELTAGVIDLGTSKEPLRGALKEADEALDSPKEAVHWQAREQTEQTPPANRRVVVGLSELADKDAGGEADGNVRGSLEELQASMAGDRERLVGLEGLQVELREVELRKKALANLSSFLKAKSTAGAAGATAGKQIAHVGGVAKNQAAKRGVDGKKLILGQKASNSPRQEAGTRLVVRKVRPGLPKAQASNQRQSVQKGLGKVPVGVVGQVRLTAVAELTSRDGGQPLRQAAVKRTGAKIMNQAGKSLGTVAPGRKQPGQAGAGIAKLPRTQLVKNRVGEVQVGSQPAAPGNKQPSTGPPTPPAPLSGGAKVLGQPSVQTSSKYLHLPTRAVQLGRSVKVGLLALHAKEPLNGPAKTAAGGRETPKGATLVAGKVALMKTAPAMRAQMAGNSPRGPFLANKTLTGVSSKLRWVRPGALIPKLTTPGNTLQPLTPQSKPASNQTSMVTQTGLVRNVENRPLEQPKTSTVQKQAEPASAQGAISVKVANFFASAQPKASLSLNTSVKDASVRPLQKRPTFAATSLGKSKGSVQPQRQRPLLGSRHPASSTWQRTTAAASNMMKTGSTLGVSKLRWVRKEV